jgi:aryl-alcohol dehydrogenase-like predicted oxidoreductase
MDTVHHRTWIGKPECDVSRVSLGCWPIAGITSLNVTDENSVATIQEAIDCGIDFFDTAYSYGYDGRSDRVIAKALRGRRSTVKIAHKVGQSWNERRERVVDGRPATLFKHAQECLRRLDTDYVDLMYLHSPDPQISLSESASAIQEIVNRGWARFAGVCNVNGPQSIEFMAHCQTSAIQIPFNMLQQHAFRELLPIVENRNIRLVCYWVYMKGLLAGHFERNHQFSPNDKRLTYDIYRGDAWERAQNLLDVLRAIAFAKNCAVSQVVMAWTLLQPQVGVALVGAKTPMQISETAGVMRIQLSTEEMARIDDGIQANGHYQ